jgi:hypothetical protein
MEVTNVTLKLRCERKNGERFTSIVEDVERFSGLVFASNGKLKLHVVKKDGSEFSTLPIIFFSVWEPK